MESKGALAELGTSKPPRRLGGRREFKGSLPLFGVSLKGLKEKEEAREADRLI